MRLSLLSIALLISTAAHAQTMLGTVTSDLDQNGTAEVFTLIDSGQGYATLEIENTAKGLLKSHDIAWVGGMDGQIPYLALAPNGSVQVISINDSVGRDRWQLTLTIAYRDNDYRVAGYTYEWNDTLDLASNGICDVNILAGKGETSLNGGPNTSFATDEFATPVTDWSDSSFGPNEACFPQ